MARAGLVAAAFALIAAAPQDAAAPAPAAQPSAAVTPPPVAATVPTPLPTPTPATRASPAPRTAATPAPRTSPAPAPRASPAPAPRANSAPRETERADPIERPTEPPRRRVAPVAAASSIPTTVPVPPTDDRGGLISPSAISRPAPLPSPAPITGLRERPTPPLWPFVAGAAALALITVGIAMWRRRRSRSAATRTEFARSDAAENAPGTGFWSPSVPADLPLPVAVPPQPEFLVEPEPEFRPGADAPSFLAPAVSRAWIDLDLKPRRAGLNLLTATADVEIALVNAGDAAARDVRIDVRMVNAAEATEDVVSELFDAAMGRPVVPPFALEAGDARSVRAVATMPREAIRPLKMGDREIFVPVLAIDVRYDAGDGTGQTAAAWMIGITREGAEKLVPFRLDAAKMHERVGARVHGAARRV